MSHGAKTISVHALQAAFGAALDAARKQHPDFPLAELPVSEPVELIYRPWIVCGFRLPWPWAELNDPDKAAFIQTFTKNLSNNRQIAALGVEGKFEPAVYVAGNQATVGFVPGDGRLNG